MMIREIFYLSGHVICQTVIFTNRNKSNGDKNGTKIELYVLSTTSRPYKKILLLLIT